jgi:hypothetical protein
VAERAGEETGGQSCHCEIVRVCKGGLCGRERNVSLHAGRCVHGLGRLKVGTTEAPSVLVWRSTDGEGGYVPLSNNRQTTLKYTNVERQ